MAGNKNIVISKFPHLSFTNDLDAGLYVWLKKYSFKFERRVKVDLLEPFDYNNSIISPLRMLLHNVIVDEIDNPLAILLIRKYFFHLKFAI